MKRKKAYLIINPKNGENVAKLADMLAVFSAANWKTDIALKEFGGHTEELAREASEDGYDLVISYGGDGTLNHVINGIMAVKNHSTVVGVIPGGTANVWAQEIGIPEDPVKAALFLVNSKGRKVDLGRVELDAPSLPSATKGKMKPASEGGQHFLLMAGLGVDAAVMRQVSAPLKEKVGQGAVAVAAAKKIPSQRPFPVEIRSEPIEKDGGLHWKGEALQVIVGNTRRYGNVAEATSEAYIDDGVLDVCVITAGDPLNTFEQILSTLLHRAPVEGRSEYFKGAHFWISVPASIDLQLDGSLVKIKNRTSMPDSVAPPKEGDTDIVMSTYRFDAMPRAISAAIPFTYDDTLFENGSGEAKALDTERDPAQEPVHVEVEGAGNGARQSPEQVAMLLDHGQKVVVLGVGPNPERKGTYIIAGSVADEETGESEPVAVRIDGDTALVRPAGDPLPSTFPAKLPEGGVIVVEGKESKRGVIRAKRVVVMNGTAESE